jgi:hypothetical protein
MHYSQPFSFRHLRLVVIAILVAISSGHIGRHGDSGVGGLALAQTPPIPAISANDVSWLFPAPTRAENFYKLISLGDLTTQNQQNPTKRDQVWPDAAFQSFLETAAAAQVPGTQSNLGFPPEAKSRAAWFIAGIRIDPGAPGLSNDIARQFGQSPEIRLIVQPVIKSPDGTPIVLDIAGHLIFDFLLQDATAAQAGCFPRKTPDTVAFKAIVADLVTLRTKLSNGQLGANRVMTSGVPLGVHPGLADATTAIGVRQAMKSFLEAHISGDKLDAMAIAGVPAGAQAPWIFLSMLRLPNGLVVPVPGPTLDGQQTAQMFNPGGGDLQVIPVPHTNNLNSITCNNAAIPNTSFPISARNGSSTTELFVNPAPPADKTRAILDLIADPTRSHFFNTDCISCHTETRRAMDLLQIQSIPGIDPAVLPKGAYTVRNFGWSPPSDGPIQAIVTKRAAAETAAVVAFINSKLLDK